MASRCLKGSITESSSLFSLMLGGMIMNNGVVAFAWIVTNWNSLEKAFVILVLSHPLMSNHVLHNSTHAKCNHWHTISSRLFILKSTSRSYPTAIYCLITSIIHSSNWTLNACLKGLHKITFVGCKSLV